jgi:UDP-N-acetylmuramate-alanine ligase
VPRLKGNEVLLVMSNGGFGGIHGKLLDALRAREA